MDQELGIGSRIRHPEFGDGVIINVKSKTYAVVFMERGATEVSKSFHALEVIENIPADSDLVSFAEVERSLINIIKRYSDLQETVSLGQRWVGGTMVLQPGDKTLKAKEIPIDTFFHKIVMLRDRLRVLEQRINAHSVMTDEDKVNMQQYITRIYGSLTTFNVLFKNSEDQFTGEKGKE